MWAHYANNHNGVLVEYEFENVDFAKNFKSRLPWKIRKTPFENVDFAKNFKSDEGGYKIYDSCKRDYHFSASDVYKKEVE